MVKNQNGVARPLQVLTPFPHRSMDLCLPLFPSSPFHVLPVGQVTCLGPRDLFHLLIPPCLPLPLNWLMQRELVTKPRLLLPVSALMGKYSPIL